MRNGLGTDVELPFGSPWYDLNGHGPPEDVIVHYGRATWPLCGEDGLGAAYTDDPHRVAGCDECLELVAEDLADDN